MDSNKIFDEEAPKPPENPESIAWVTITPDHPLFVSFNDGTTPPPAIMIEREGDEYGAVSVDEAGCRKMLAEGKDPTLKAIARLGLEIALQTEQTRLCLEVMKNTADDWAKTMMRQRLEIESLRDQLGVAKAEAKSLLDRLNTGADGK